MPKNYYIILGIPANSNEDDIKAAYRRLAKEYHPDYFGSNQAPFQMIHEAYSVLSDPARRRSYDNNLEDGIIRYNHPEPDTVDVSKDSSHVEPLIPKERPPAHPNRSLDRSIHHYNSLFDGLFDRMLSGFYEDRHPQFTLNRTIEVQLTSDQAAKGGNVRLKVPMQIRCPSCNSAGQRGVRGCWRCNGAGYLTGERQLLLSYPAGVRSGHTIQLPVTRINNRDISLTAVIQIYERS